MIEIVGFNKKYSEQFFTLNKAWIEESWHLEDSDKKDLLNPDKIFEDGGQVFFALENKIAIVTGAASGLGFAASQKLMDEGAKVLLTDINDNGAATCNASTTKRVLGTFKPGSPIKINSSTNGLEVTFSVIDSGLLVNGNSSDPKIFSFSSGALIPAFNVF